MKKLLLVLPLFYQLSALAQITVEITGPTTSGVGETKQYNLVWRDGFNQIESPFGGITNWYTPGGLVPYSDESGATVQWTSTGNQGLYFEYSTWNDFYYDDLYVNVTAALSAPTAILAIDIASTSFTARWNSVSGATSYKLDVATNSSFHAQYIVGIYNNLSVSGTTQGVSGLSANTTYHYRVQASNSSGTSSESNIISVTTAPAIPTGTTSTSSNSSSFTAGWSAVTGATSYLLDVSAKSDFSSFVPGYQNYPLTGTSKFISNLPTKQNYFFRVRAVNSGGTSGYSTIKIAINNDQNYIRTMDVLVGGKATLSAVVGGSISDRSDSYTFFDGLGRPMQSVSIQASPNQKDIVQPIVYDKFGRETRKYLPFTTGTDEFYRPTNEIIDVNGNYIGIAQPFYAIGSNNNIADDTKPFSETILEPSPLNRPAKQYGAGLAWRPIAEGGNNKYIGMEYLLNNSATENVIAWDLNGSGAPVRHAAVANYVLANGYYATGQLSINVTKDEAGNSVREYTNKQGQVVLKKVQFEPTQTLQLNNREHWASTYYIYDDLGNLRYVFPPELTRLLHANDFAVPSTSVDGELDIWAFQYKYDAKNRMSQKKVPGAEWIYMVYDERDRLVLTQDGNQRLTGNQKDWSFTKYDNLNRPIITGIYTHTTTGVSQSDMQDYVEAQMNTPAKFYEVYKGSIESSNLGYTNQGFPSSSMNLLTVTYYDKHDTYIAPSGYTYTTESLVDPETGLTQETTAKVNAARLNGQAVGSLIKKLGTQTWMRTVNYYDQKYRLVQSISDHQKGKVTISNIVDFIGQVVYTKRNYIVSGISTPIIENPHYDHTGRLLYLKHKTKSATEVFLVKNNYNELGQLIDKKLHSTSTAGAGAKQSIDYTYNIRGWLTKINEANVSATVNDDNFPDYFGMELGYNKDISGQSTNKYYNGNIGAISWSKGNGGSVARQTYNFDYDAMNRLENAHHLDYKFSGWQSNNNAFGEYMTYDLNGNIETLLRNGFNGVVMDILDYDYTDTGNKLNYVHDTGNGTTGFKNGNTGTDDYSYDHNGNLDKDKNKGINVKGDIKYNHLNLPIEVKKSSTGERIVYIYDATGKKLSQEVYNSSNGLTKVTDYIGELVYEGTTTPVLQFIQHAEGRVLPDGPSNWEYQYHLKDHLGNVRITFTTKAQTTTTSTANFETSTNSAFLNYIRMTFDLVDHTDAGTVYNKVQWLNGGINGRVGIAKSIPVMPGDEVTMSAFAKYMNYGTSPNPNAFLTSLASAFGVGPTSVGEQLKIYNGLSNYAATVPGGDHPDDDENPPKAFVNIIFFDKDYNFLDAAWEQITTAGAQTHPTIKQPPHSFMTVSAKAPEAGYAYVFVSNEHPNYVDVYYDDVTVTHTPSPIVGVSDYYPFGLTFNSYQRENSAQNKYLFNQGFGEKKFLTERIFDLDLNIDLSRFRSYDPAIARWWQVDPLATDVDELLSLTPYNYSFNNPIRYNDPEGDCPCILPIAWGVSAIVEALVVAGVGTVIVATVSEFSDEIWDAMGNASPYSTPGVDFAQSGGGVKSLNASGKNNSQSSGSSNTEKKETGSYTNTHDSGKKYHGKGGENRAKKSAERVSEENKDPAKKTVWKKAEDDREAFIDEAKRIKKDGGVENPNNYNKINSPGKKYIEEDKNKKN